VKFDWRIEDVEFLTLITKPVVLNRGAAEPLGAAESSRGAANFWIWLVFTNKMLLGVPPIC